jgi:cbb3-type cytochrome oxidase subunit 3
MIDFITHHAGLLGLLFFFIFFCGMGLWVLRPGARTLYKNYARIPFEESDR